MLEANIQKCFTVVFLTCAGADTRELSGTMTILMELRKAANHPLLHRCHYTDGILKEMATSLMQVRGEGEKGGGGGGGGGRKDG